MVVIFEDNDKSWIVEIYRKLLRGHTVIGSGGNKNIRKVLSDAQSIVYIDICIDNIVTADIYNRLVANNPQVLFVPIPNAEYLYLQYCKQHGLVVEDDIVDAALQVVGYSQANKYNSRNYEKFCKAVARNALIDCAVTSKAISTPPTYMHVDCLCGSALQSCAIESLVSKEFSLLAQLPVQPDDAVADMQAACSAVCTLVDRWNSIGVPLKKGVFQS